MRVLHVISGLDPANGGPTFVVSGLSAALVRAGLDVTVVATFQNTSGNVTAERMRAAGVKVELIGPARGKLSHHPQIPPVLRRLVGEADVVHVHALWEQIQHEAAREAQHQGKPYVVTPHGMLSHWSMGQKWLRKRVVFRWRVRRNLRRAAAVHFTTAVERDASAPRLNAATPSFIEPLGVDLAEFRDLPAKGSFRRRYAQLAGARPIVMFLGRIHPGKGMEYLVPAFARAQLGAEVMLVAAGPDSGGFAEVIRKLAQENGVADRTIFTGMLSAPERIAALADADLFALPSEHENFGVVVVEALACATPVVISDGVAIHGEIAAAQVGAVVPSRDVAALAGELKRWMGDEALRRGAAERARPLVAQRFDWDAIARRWVEHYQRALRGNKAT